jgi:hypothetical protein
MEADAHPGELHPLGEQQFSTCLKDTENERLSYKGKYSGRRGFRHFHKHKIGDKPSLSVNHGRIFPMRPSRLRMFGA